jgi:hypothetical protein
MRYTLSSVPALTEGGPANGVQPQYRILQHTRHRMAEMIARYVREAAKWTRSGLKGVWRPFRAA